MSIISAAASSSWYHSLKLDFGGSVVCCIFSIELKLRRCEHKPYAVATISQSARIHKSIEKSYAEVQPFLRRKMLLYGYTATKIPGVSVA